LNWIQIFYQREENKRREAREREQDLTFNDKKVDREIKWNWYCTREYDDVVVDVVCDITIIKIYVNDILDEICVVCKWKRSRVGLTSFW